MDLAADQPRILLTRRIPEPAMRRLADQCQLTTWPGHLPPDRKNLLTMVEGIDGLLCLLSEKVDAELLDRAGPQLKVVSNYAVGVNNIDLDEAKRRGIPIGNTPDVLTDATADIAVTLLLAVARRVKEASDQVRDGTWETWDPTGLLGHELSSQTLGIVGMGRIGQATAKRLSAGWGMRVIYTSRRAKPEIDEALNARHVSMDELFAESDFISVHTDLNPSTHHLINGAALEKMKPTAVLVNTARGDVVDQDALVHALQNNQIWGAGLDVTTPEPLNPSHPLVSLPNCLILPHVGSATEKARQAMAEIAVDNVLAGVQQQPLRSAVH